MTNDERKQRMAERILEDESLRGDLEDDAATALVAWASERAAAAAADPGRPDDELEIQVGAIRQAARAAARSGETEPRRLIALAEARLAPAVAPTAAQAGDIPSTAPERRPASADQVAPPPASQAVVRSGGEHAGDAPQKSRPAAAEERPRPSDAVSAAQPATPAAARPRRRRSRLARFLKRLRGER
jgi:hypothetical protein